jgi:hypothetical protein
MRILFLVFFCLLASNSIAQKAKLEFNGKPRDKVVLDFVDFKLTLFNVEVWNEDAYLSTPHKDTIEIFLGSSATNQKWLLNTPIESLSLDVLQQYQTSFSVSDEGSHLDLLDWKHHTSEWKKVSVISDTLYTIGYTDKEEALFPPITKTALLKEISRMEKDSRWKEKVSQLKFPIQTSDFVSISKITFKFVCKVKSFYSTKILVVNLPMGC